MEITSLQAFIAVAESSSFSRAAERLHLTQPAVSKRVAALEGELGTALFDRIGRRTLLTEAGHALLPRARRILDELDDSRRAIANLSGRVEGELRIGTSHHIGLHRLPPALRRYSRRYPEVRMDIRFLGSEDACRAVEQGELELGIVTLPLAPPERLLLTQLWPDPLQVVCGLDHPLTSLEKLSPRALAGYPAILPESGTFTRQLVEEAFRPHGLEVEIGLSTNYLETIRMLVSVGLGWSVLPETLIDKDIHRLSVPGVSLTRQLGLVRHRDRTLSNAATAMVELLSAPKTKTP